MGLLRFLLAAAVVAAHTQSFWGLKLVGGQLAVETFFIISGFYMSLILTEKYVGKNKSFTLFITNRLLRLWPIYITIIGFITVISCGFGFFTEGKNWWMLDIFIKNFHSFTFSSTLFILLTNLVILGQDLVYFIGISFPQGNLYFISNYSNGAIPLYNFLLIPQAWTISIELLFYLIAPFVIRLKTRYILLLTAVSIGIKILLNRTGLNFDPWIYRFFPAELCFFFLGILSYRLQHLLIIKKTLAPYILFCIVIAFTLFFSLLSIPFLRVVYLLFLATSIPIIFDFTKRNKLDKIVGELSYPIYLTHVFVWQLLALTKFNFGSYLGFTVLGLSIILSIALNKLIVDRIENFRQLRVKAN